MSSLSQQLAGMKPSAVVDETPQRPDVARPLPPHREPGKRPAASAPSAAYASLQPASTVHLVGFPLRLSTDAVDQLRKWKRSRGITPGLLVREMVEKGIADLQVRFEKESQG